MYHDTNYNSKLNTTTRTIICIVRRLQASGLRRTLHLPMIPNTKEHVGTRMNLFSEMSYRNVDV